MIKRSTFLVCLALMGLTTSTAYAQDMGQRELTVEDRLANLEKRVPYKKKGHPFDMWFGGRVRLEGTAILESDDNNGADFVGKNDGFTVDARLNANGKFKMFEFRIEFDGTTLAENPQNQPGGPLRTGITDAYSDVNFELGETKLKVRGGQFKVPFDQEEIRSTADMLFVRRPVESRGVQNVEGWNIQGLSPARQQGMLAEAKWHPNKDGFGLVGTVAATNGSDARRFLNDNEEIAGFGRLEARLGDMLKVGGAGYYAVVSTGEEPDLFDEERLGFVADLEVTTHGVIVQAQYMQTNFSFPDVPDGDRSAAGYHAALGYRIEPIDIIPAVRYAAYDPTSSFPAGDGQTNFDVDEVQEIAFGINYEPAKVFKTQLSYTMVMENDARAIDNDRLEFLMQSSF